MNKNRKSDFYTENSVFDLRGSHHLAPGPGDPSFGGVGGGGVVLRVHLAIPEGASGHTYGCTGL